MTRRRDRRWRARRWVAAAALGALAAAALLRNGLPPPGEPGRPPYVTIFLIDGLSQRVFEEELAAGHLPEMQRLIRDGVYVRDGVVAFPSMTGYGFYPYLTGRDAPASGVLGLRWLDRGRAEGGYRNYVGRSIGRMNEDLAPEPPTLFERVAPRHTLAVNNSLDRGAHHHVVNGLTFALSKYREHWWLPRLLSWLPGDLLAPDLDAAERKAIDVAIDDLPNEPQVHWISLSAPDAYHHLHGTDAGYVRLIRVADSEIGRYRAAAQAVGQDRDRVYVVVSDHGVADVRVNVDLAAALGAAGVSAVTPPAVVLGADLDEPLVDVTGDADVLVAVNGNTLNYLYVRDGATPGPAGFATPRTAATLRAHPGRDGPVDLVATLLAVEGVEHVIVRGDDGGVQVHGRAGVGVARAAPAGVAWSVRGEDPFGYADSDAAGHLADGQPHSDSEWLAATHAGPWPSAVPAVATLMAAPDAGDLVVTARAGYDLALDFEAIVGSYRGGHGGLRADQLRVPFLMAGPGLRAGTELPAAHARDVGATVLALLGLPAAPSAEGRILSEALRAGPPATAP